jgi:hypothetical protein
VSTVSDGREGVRLVTGGSRDQTDNDGGHDDERNQRHGRSTFRLGEIDERREGCGRGSGETS